MAREVNKLNAKSVNAIAKPGRHGDGGGLYLQVSGSGGRSWLFLYRDRQSGKLREKGLGSASVVGLAQARELAAAARKLVADGLDPIAVAKLEPVAAPKVPTFGEVADAFVDSMASGFRNAKTADQWRMTLSDTYCGSIRSRPVRRDRHRRCVGGAQAALAQDPGNRLAPAWQDRAGAGSREGKGLSERRDPAMWRGHLDTLLPKRQKLSRGHYPAMPYESHRPSSATCAAAKALPPRCGSLS